METYLQHIPFDKKNTLLHPPSDGKFDTLCAVYKEASEQKSEYCDRFVKQVDDWTNAYEKAFGEFNESLFMALLKEISETYSAYEFVMGGAKKGEDADEVAAREFLEETGVEMGKYNARRAIIREGRRGTRVTVVYDISQMVVPNYGSYIKNMHLNMAQEKEGVNFSFTVREADGIFWADNISLNHFGYPTTEVFLNQIKNKEGVEYTGGVTGVTIRNVVDGLYMLQRSDRSMYRLKDSI